MFKWLIRKENNNNHPMIGRVYKLDNNNPFKNYFVKVVDVKQNAYGVEWVKFNMIFKNGTVYARDRSEKMDVFLYCYKECTE